MLDYTSIPALADFDLGESYVLGIEKRSGTVEIRMDLVLAKTHPELRPPRPGEWTDIREGVIRFTGVTEFDWDDPSRPATEPDGSTSWDGFHAFTQDGTTYRLSGGPGTLLIVADRVDCEFTAELGHG